jgi:hemerythrin
MQKIEWTESLSIGNQSLDDEHKKFIELINVLITAHNAGNIVERMDSMLNNIIAFAEDHFDHEEESMRSKRYCGLREQELAHQRLMTSMINIRNEWRKYKTQRATIDFANLLRNWIFDHLLKLDKQYGKFLMDSENEAMKSSKDK